MRTRWLPKRKSIRRNRPRVFHSFGFSTTELLVVLALTGIVLGAIYQVATKNERTANAAVRKTLLSRQALLIKKDLERALRNLGYNPRHVPYDTTMDTDAWTKRVGITLVDPHQFYFQSDDNDQYDPTSKNTLDGYGDPLTGKIQKAELYGYFVMPSPESAYAITISDIGDIPLSGAELLNLGATGQPPCTRSSSIDYFSEAHTLVRLVKSSDDPDNQLENPTVPVVVADNVVCFGIRYLDTDGTEVSPSGPIDSTYYETLLRIARIQIGIVLMDPRTTRLEPDPVSGTRKRTETIRVDVRLPNAWDIADVNFPVDLRGG